ncbi:MAG: PhzF family phenazine biosynthesis protein [Planctomycetes bacterium]|nr:PhzF family phenazine biosynthesis protein [Planctomycetota bacterium]MCB9890716.1 PhzF family phenazine biosynthesis protein [Planctomycetota bacterium]MCB9920061.1 PhzF family phenazine biosynthesis protein [Planctomycetota bacterium]
MNPSFPFRQVDVFSPLPHRGNPLAVVLAADGLADDRMAAFARWTNLSETAFLLPPNDPEADYRVRIFTPHRELPFAGHPTLGSCHAWLEAGNAPRERDRIVQECGVGLVTIVRQDGRLAFAAPPLQRSGPLDDDRVDGIARACALSRADIVAHQWTDNGPGWQAVLLESAEDVLRLAPDPAILGDIKLGVVGPHPAGSECAFEVRAFVPSLGVPEDPVTGSLNAGLAQWLIGARLAPKHYVAAQGTAMQRSGRVHVQQDDDGTVWIGGDCTTCVEGSVRF